MGKQVVVIGGGIIGLSSAYFLQKEGHQVTVIDKSNMNGGASYVNAGYLTPSHIVPLAAPGMISTGLRYMLNASSPFYIKPRWDPVFFDWIWKFKKSSTQKKVENAMPYIRDFNIMSRELFEEIKDSNDLGSFHYERKGLVMYFQSEKVGEHEIKIAERAQTLGLDSKILDREDIKSLEPKFEVNALGAVHYLCDGHTTPTEFLEKLKAYLTAKNVKIHKNEMVEDVAMSDEMVVKVCTNKNTYDVDEVLLSAGSWSSEISKKIGLKLSLQAGKGYRIDDSGIDNINMPAILLEKKIAVTPMQGFTRFAGTMEFSGLNNFIRKNRVEAIASGAADFYKNLSISESAKTNAECGLRPVSPDGLPYIGRVEQAKNVVVATGHAMMGWSLGPATGKLVSELISNRKTSLDITPYHPNRRF